MRQADQSAPENPFVSLYHALSHVRQGGVRQGFGVLPAGLLKFREVSLNE